MTTYASVADIKNYLYAEQAINLPTDDPLLTDLLNSACALFDRFVGYNILTASYTEVRHGNGHPSIATRNFPITAVASVTVDGNAIVVAPDTISYGYVFDNEMIYIRCPRINYAFDVVGYLPGGYAPINLFSGSPTAFTKGIGNVSLVYTAGLASVPADVKEAIVNLVVYRYKQKDRVGVVSHSTQNMATDSFIVDDVPASVRSTMLRYKRVVIV